MKKLLLVCAFGALAASSVGAAAREPSESCANGEVAPGTTPAGIGARQGGDPYQEPTSLYACNTAKVVRRPAKGLVWVRVDNAQQRAHVIVDGDSDNGTLGCTDGYVAARVGGDGARFYQASDGDFSFIARERSPEDVARRLAADCRTNVIDQVAKR